MPDKKKGSWADLPAAVSYGITRWESSSEEPKDRFHFPAKDIPRRSARVWALGDKARETEWGLSFAKAFEGVARSGNYASSPMVGEVVLLRSSTLTLLALEREGLSPAQVIERELSDWKGVRESLERWAKEAFGPGRYLINSEEESGDNENTPERAQGLLAFWEREQLEGQQTHATPGARKSGPAL